MNFGITTISLVSLIILSIGCTDAQFTSVSGGSTSLNSLAVSSESNFDESLFEDYTPPVCGETHHTPLMAGQHHLAGGVTIELNGDLLTVTIDAQQSVEITEYHIDVAQNRSGISNSPGRMLIVKELSSAATQIVEVINIADLGLSAETGIALAIHAVVQPIAGNEGEVIEQEETAWGYGKPGVSGWGWYIEYCTPTTETETPGTETPETSEPPEATEPPGNGEEVNKDL